MVENGIVFRIDEGDFVDRGNGIRSIPLCGPGIGSAQLLTGITEIPPGVAIPLHTHSSEEFVLVLEGAATVRIEDRETSVSVGEATFIRADTAHQFFNNGDSPLRILWCYGEIDSTRTIVATGETMGHLDRYSAE